MQQLATRVEQLKQQVLAATSDTPPDHEVWIAKLGKTEGQPPTDDVVCYRFDDVENRYREEVSGTGGSFHEFVQQLTYEISHSRDQFSRSSDKTFRVVRTLR